MKLLRRIMELPNGLWNRLQFSLLETEFRERPVVRGRLVAGGRGRFITGKNVVINSSERSNPVGAKNRTSIHVAAGAEVVLGDNVGISNSLFYAVKSITVEDNVLIGGGCQIYDTDFHSIGYEDRVLNGDKAVKSAPVLIREGVFIGTGVIILKGVTIGARSVIAAGSIVAKDIPPHEVWGGNPARFIKKLS